MTWASVEDIKNLLQRFSDERRRISREIWMVIKGFEGGMTMNDAWGMSPEQRHSALKFLAELNEAQEQRMKSGRRG